MRITGSNGRGRSLKRGRGASRRRTGMRCGLFLWGLWTRWWDRLRRWGFSAVSDQFDAFESMCAAQSTWELISAALMQPDELPAWYGIWELQKRGTREVFEAAVSLCRSECPVERTLG